MLMDNDTITQYCLRNQQQQQQQQYGRSGEAATAISSKQTDYKPSAWWTVAIETRGRSSHMRKITPTPVWTETSSLVRVIRYKAKSLPFYSQGSSSNLKLRVLVAGRRGLNHKLTPSSGFEDPLFPECHRRLTTDRPRYRERGSYRRNRFR